jgi:hypothetical protein
MVHSTSCGAHGLERAHQPADATQAHCELRIGVHAASSQRIIISAVGCLADPFLSLDVKLRSSAEKHETEAPFSLGSTFIQNTSHEVTLYLVLKLFRVGILQQRLADGSAQTAPLGF